MVICSCGKKIEKIPNWMKGIKVDYVCNHCPNRNIKNIALVSNEIDQANAAKLIEDKNNLDRLAAEMDIPLSETEVED